MPESVDLKTVIPPEEMHGKWVQVDQPLKIYCEPIETEYQLEEQILFGRIESTYFLAEIPGSQKFVVLQRDRKAVCSDVQQMPLVGVLTELNPRLGSTLLSRGMVFPRNGFTMLLCLSCGPRQSVLYLIFLPLMIILSVWLMNRSWRAYSQQKVRRQSTLLGSA